MLGKILDKMAMSELNAAGSALSSLKAGPVEQARVAAGHMLGRAAGGALVGAGVNGYEYSQTGTGFGGSFSMGESLVSGAAAGAIVGGVVGALGARRAAQSVTANAAKAQRRFDAAVAKAEKRGLTGFTPVMMARRRSAPADIASEAINSDRAAIYDAKRAMARDLLAPPPVGGPRINLLVGRDLSNAPRGRIEPTVHAINPVAHNNSVPHAQNNMNTTTLSSPVANPVVKVKVKRGKGGRRGKGKKK